MLATHKTVYQFSSRGHQTAQFAQSKGGKGKEKARSGSDRAVSRGARLSDNGTCEETGKFLRSVHGTTGSAWPKHSRTPQEASSPWRLPGTAASGWGPRGTRAVTSPGDIHTGRHSVSALAQPQGPACPPAHPVPFPRQAGSGSERCFDQLRVPWQGGGKGNWDSDTGLGFPLGLPKLHHAGIESSPRRTCGVQPGPDGRAY